MQMDDTEKAPDAHAGGPEFSAVPQTDSERAVYHNEAMPEVTGAIAEDRLMTACNKWLIAYEESGLGADGAFAGLTGKNLKTNI